MLNSLIDRYLRNKAAPGVRPLHEDPEPAQEIVTCGVYERGGCLFICAPDDTTKARVIKVVTMPLSVYRRYQAAHYEWSLVQQILDGYPKTLRERKPPVRKTKVDPFANLPQSPAENPV